MSRPYPRRIRADPWLIHSFVHAIRYAVQLCFLRRTPMFLLMKQRPKAVVDAVGRKFEERCRVGGSPKSS